MGEIICAEVSELADAPAAPTMITQRWEECHCDDSMRELSLTCSLLYGTVGLSECLQTSVTPDRFERHHCVPLS